MALPRALEARAFYQAAYQRLEDAQILLEKARRTTGATYLAGYSIECIFKALVLAQLNPRKRREMLSLFRGSRAHDLEWLSERYREHGGPMFPSDVSKCFAMANTWTTELRYLPAAVRFSDAEAFLEAARHIVTWADGRMGP